MTTVTNCTDAAVWDEIVHDFGGHPLQLWGWGEVKAAHHWNAHRLIITNDTGHVIGAAQVLTRSLPWPFRRLCYIPRGPVAHQPADMATVLTEIQRYVRHHLPGTVLTIEPHAETLPSAAKGWVRSQNTILIPRTLILDLSLSADELLAQMTKKTRQYIRKSGREDIVIRRVRQRDELAACMTIYRETAKRAGFSIHDDEYYADVFSMMGDSSVIFGAFHGEKLVAFLWLAVGSHLAFELYGGMNADGQQLRANYALKWHAITRCQEWGLSEYDMNGLLNDGVSTFKKGFASHESLLAGTYDYPMSPLYPLWSKGLPKVKRILRSIKSLSR